MRDVPKLPDGEQEEAAHELDSQRKAKAARPGKGRPVRSWRIHRGRELVDAGTRAGRFRGIRYSDKVSFELGDIVQLRGHVVCLYMRFSACSRPQSVI